jgi:hypothetical protein
MGGILAARRLLESWMGILEVFTYMHYVNGAYSFPEKAQSLK